MSKADQPAGVAVDRGVRRRPLLARLEALQDKSGPYGKLIRPLAEGRGCEYCGDDVAA